MFKENLSHCSPDMFGILNQLPPSKVKRLQDMPEYYFYEYVFSKINENDFSCLYDQETGRPNSPVNQLIAAIILKEKRGISCEELFDQIAFDVRFRFALGIDSLSEIPFSPATFFNFLNRLSNHYLQSKENLLEKVFDHLTKEQLEKLNLKTDIQRMDSFQAMSNIVKYSRLHLILEVLLRFYNVLEKKDIKKVRKLLHPYLDKKSQEYVYGLKGENLEKELEKLGQIYHELYKKFEKDYRDLKIFEIFERVFEEHFKVENQKTVVKESNELHSGCIQSPDDIDATYRKKREKDYQGQVVNVTETANPENTVNLITNVSVDSNNVDDSKLLNQEIQRLKEKTPDLNELHTDGGYGSSDNDQVLEEKKITHYQTAIKGPKNENCFEIEKGKDEDDYNVSCKGNQSVKAKKTPKRYKANFSQNKCMGCKHATQCSVLNQKSCNVFYFSDDDYLLQERRRRFKELPPERQKIRPNIEATVKEFTKSFNHKGKLRVRGRFKTEIFAFVSAIGINFGRVCRYAMA